METPKDVKTCIFANIKDEIKDKLNECLTKQSVPVVKEIPEGIMKHLTEMLTGGGDEEHKKLL